MSCYDKVEARMVAHKGELYQALTDALNDIILDRDLALNIKSILDRVQKSLDTRQESHSDIEPIYANIEVINDVFDALEPITNMDVENDRFIDRTDKLEQVKIDISRVKAMA